MNKLLIIAIGITFGAQIFVPVNMIFNKEKVLFLGKTYKFKTAPIDPIDPLRGKYVRLDFEADQTYVDTTYSWAYDQTVFLTFNEDEEGFSKIDKVYMEEPKNLTYYLKARASCSGRTVYVDYPFTAFYMEESKAYPAEMLYRRSNINVSQKAYALVSIYEGRSLLKEVYINDKPIKEAVEIYMENIENKSQETEEAELDVEIIEEVEIEMDVEVETIVEEELILE